MNPIILLFIDCMERQYYQEYIILMAFFNVTNITHHNHTQEKPPAIPFATREFTETKVIFQAPERLEARQCDTPEPKITDQNQIMKKVVATAVCNFSTL